MKNRRYCRIRNGGRSRYRLKPRPNDLIISILTTIFLRTLEKATWSNERWAHSRTSLEGSDRQSISASIVTESINRERYKTLAAYARRPSSLFLNHSANTFSACLDATTS